MTISTIVPLVSEESPEFSQENRKIAVMTAMVRMKKITALGEEKFLEVLFIGKNPFLGRVDTIYYTAFKMICKAWQNCNHLVTINSEKDLYLEEKNAII